MARKNSFLMKKRKAKIRSFAKETAAQILKWAQEKYKLSDKINDPIIVVSFDKKRVYSYGGWMKNRQGQWRPYINLNFYTCLNYAPQVQEEYEWYEKDPVIGKRWAATWRQWAKFEIAHEVAHVIEMAGPYLEPEQKKRLTKKFGRSRLSDDHTETFQRIYRVIRRRFVNRARKIK